MAQPETRLLERGYFSLHHSDASGTLHLVLSPEGDTHRLIGLQRDGSRLRGRILAIAGRLTNIQGVLPRDAGIAAAGRYRLERLGGFSLLEFTGEEMAPDRAPIPLTGGEGWSVRAGLPNGEAERRTLPAHVLARFSGRPDAALEPDVLDYVGMRLVLVPAEAALVEASSRVGWRGPAPVGERWTG